MEELAAFDQWTGPSRLEIKKVEFRNVDGPYNGRSFRSTDTVALDVGLDSSEIRNTLRHELCHLLDFSEDLASVEGVFEPYAEYLFENEVRSYRANHRIRRSEALATACESGPLGAAALAFACGGDTAYVDEMMAWMGRHVWTGADVANPPAVVEFAHSEAPNPWSSFQVYATPDPQVILISVIASDDPNVIWFFMSDLATGGTVLGVPLDGVPSVELPREHFPPEGLALSAYGWVAGPAAGLIEYELPGLESSSPRMIVMHDGEWRLGPQPCFENVPGAIFTAADQVWYAWGDGATISWMPL